MKVELNDCVQNNLRFDYLEHITSSKSESAEEIRKNMRGVLIEKMKSMSEKTFKGEF